jgi:LmbE family N-acetylglucosaminyl deacetylase
MKVLAIAGHADDVELGLGGTLARHADNGDDVTVVLVTHSGYSGYNGQVIRTSDVANAEAAEAAHILGISNLIVWDYETKEVEYNVELIEDLNRIVDQVKPDIVYTHWAKDVNQDHTAISQATLIAARNIPCILMYQSNWHSSQSTFQGKFYVDISNFMETKIKAIEAHKSEIEKRGPTWVEFFTNKNRNDGILLGVDYAECFEIIRWMR